MKIKLAKRIGVLLIALLLMNAIAIGTWLFFIEGNVEGTIVSVDEQFSLTGAFDFGVIDTTNSSSTLDEVITITNSDNNISAQFLVATVFEDEMSDDCNHTGDCEIVFEFNDVGIQNESIINVPPSDSILTATLDCKRFSCPATLNGTWSLTGNE